MNNFRGVKTLGRGSVNHLLPIFFAKSGPEKNELYIAAKC